MVKRPRPSPLTWLAAVSLPTGLLGCGPAQQTNNFISEATTIADAQASADPPAEAVPVDDSTRSTDGWLVTQSVNPLNDSLATSAARSFTVGAFTVELEVVCDQADGLLYRATTFDSDGDGAPLNWSYGSSGARTVARLRINDEEAERWDSEPRRFSNQFSLVTSAKRFARADRLTLGFGLANGDVLMTVDQSDAAFRDAVAPCLAEPKRDGAQTGTPSVQEDVEANTLPSEERAVGNSGEGGDL